MQTDTQESKARDKRQVIASDALTENRYNGRKRKPAFSRPLEKGASCEAVLLNLIKLTFHSALDPGAGRNKQQL